MVNTKKCCTKVIVNNEIYSKNIEISRKICLNYVSILGFSKGNCLIITSFMKFINL